MGTLAIGDMVGTLAMFISAKLAMKCGLFESMAGGADADGWLVKLSKGNVGGGIEDMETVGRR